MLFQELGDRLGGNMVIRRAGASFGADAKEMEILEALADKELTEEELEDVIAEYEQINAENDPNNSLVMRKIALKKERTQDNFEAGVGGFRRK